MAKDPTESDPDKYKVVIENDRVRVLEYRDRPGDRTSPHQHPDSVMYTLASFERRLIHGEQHRGENIGDTETHVLFVELKEPAVGSAEDGGELGPASGP